MKSYRLTVGERGYAFYEIQERFAANGIIYVQNNKLSIETYSSNAEEAYAELHTKLLEFTENIKEVLSIE